MIHLYIILWTLLISSLFIMLFHFLLRGTNLLIWSGLGLFFTGGFLCILRLFLPLDLSISRYTLEYPGFLTSFFPSEHFFQKHYLIPVIVLAVMSLGAVILIISYLWRTHVGGRVLWTHSVDSARYTAILKQIDENCPIPVRETALVKVPVLFGYFHTVIYIPYGPYTEKDLYNIIRHEYTHWKHHHLPVKFCLHISTLLMWWNPFIHILERDISHIIELLCDELTLTPSEEQEKLEYMSTIIRCLQRNCRQSRIHNLDDCAPLHFAAENRGSSTMQRINYLFRDNSLIRRSARVMSYIFVFCLFFMTYFTVIQPAYAPEDEAQYSNSTNAYLVESKDGSYTFHYGLNSVEVSNKDVADGYYRIYPVISYREYKDSGNYKTSRTYQKYLAQQ